MALNTPSFWFQKSLALLSWFYRSVAYLSVSLRAWLMEVMNEAELAV